MSNLEKAPCGGFFIDNDSLYFEDKTLKSNGSLPEVTPEDNGDVLTVVNGAWAKAAPSGGGGVLIVGLTITIDGQTETVTADKTCGEIYAAAQKGLVIFTAEYEGTSITNILMAAEFSSSGYTFTAVNTLHGATADDYPSSGGHA